MNYFFWNIVATETGLDKFDIMIIVNNYAYNIAM